MKAVTATTRSTNAAALRPSHVLKFETAAKYTLIMRNNDNRNSIAKVAT